MIPVAVTDRIADAAAVTAVVTPTAFAVGVSIQQVNLYLQALGFIVAIISGICAARYYWTKANAK